LQIEERLDIDVLQKLKQTFEENDEDGRLSLFDFKALLKRELHLTPAKVWY
jgi:hypothetical protein